MRAFVYRKNRAPLALVLVLVGMGLTASAASAATVTINLCAVTGTASMPGSVAVPIWGFVPKGAVADCSDVQGTAAVPGPVLAVNQGDAVTINVTNALPAGPPDHTLRFEAPGISFDPGATDAAVGATVTRTFTASAPGSYLYQSGGNAGRQEAMGLYGALIVRPTTTGQAYGSPATAYDVEATLVLSQLDPAFNSAPDTYDMHKYLATYWLINGQPYPTSGITAAAGQRVLLRFLNAGFDNTSMLLLGLHERVVAREAHLLNNPIDADAETIPAGATEDAIAVIPSYAGAPSSHGFPLFNRQNHLTNGAGATLSDGGMITFIHP